MIFRDWDRSGSSWCKASQTVGNSLDIFFLKQIADCLRPHLPPAHVLRTQAAALGSIRLSVCLCHRRKSHTHIEEQRKDQLQHVKTFFRTTICCMSAHSRPRRLGSRHRFRGRKPTAKTSTDDEVYCWDKNLIFIKFSMLLLSRSIVWRNHSVMEERGYGIFRYQRQSLQKSKLWYFINNKL